MIELKNLCKSYTTKAGKVEAVKDVTLKINKGDIYGIIGFSGAGKSTLVRCINLLEKPNKGQVIIDGKNLVTLSNKELRKERKKIGMIFQHFNLMKSRTVFENIAYPLRGSGLSKEEIRGKVLSLLKLVELEDKESAYPSQLSGGQKQRVGIARALANDPKVLLCDEATSALDPQTTKSILRLLKEVNKKLNLTIVVITHEMQVVKEICTRVAVMEKGRIVEEGNIFKVFSEPKQEITRNFIESTSILSNINYLIEDKSSVVEIREDEKILKLKYLENSTTEPIISIISREFNVDANIIFGNVEIIEDAPLGGLIVIIRGEEEKVRNVIKYLEENNVEVEVIKDGRVSTKVIA
ncbi:methionine ABC transporter ATP-binding protein [Clostridium isatidis]|uniref:Methionine ABC transporter ATP-binding protein n=1 Tax=Clostridium isatidis TaxID=182773 RepID=A0A343JFR0_9CLOT|nr:methionine ABC transporter ATP-binding protein [Clostridium isatidis]ASW44368.1 methionine ABC transporter ATP-binding protein [Clostridium isatidis]